MVDPTETETCVMREQLLGYLLGALEPDEHAFVAERLSQDPQWRRELEVLRKGLAPLDDEEPEEAPKNLAAKTCQYVAARRGPVAGQFGSSSQWRLQDLLIAASLFGVAAMLLLPAMYQSRVQANVAICQSNLMSLGQALLQFSSLHDDHFPEVPAEGNLASAGIYAPLLREAGLIQDRDVLCPASHGCRSSFRIPTQEEILAARGSALRQLQNTMGGSYGYCIGYVEQGRYHARRNRNRATFAIASDIPIVRVNEVLSDHGQGQNVLFEDGHVRFVTSCWLLDGADHFFENAMGYVAAGVDEEDAVIVPSGTRPMILRAVMLDE